MIKPVTLISLFIFFDLVGHAHPVSLNWVDIRIDNELMVVRYRILVEDLIYFYHPKHDGLYNYRTDTLRALAELHGSAIVQNFRIRDDQGQSFQPMAHVANTRSISGESINVMDLMKHEIIYTTEYDFKNPNVLGVA